ncbi:MAG: class I SAM-dependent methyltransferase [Deltaproteobacteria bacterium]|nr:class I SAM-dependent methyltransferase [Deltaproteobacteria bacterium]
MADDNTHELVRALFDEWALSGRSEVMQRGHEATARQACARFRLGANQRYLDIGCGNGYSVRWAADLDASLEAVGLDVSGEMIALARKRSSEQPNARFIQAPFPLPELRSGAFDAIFSMEVFYYLPDLAAGLADVRRLLKPGGRFACVVDYFEENAASHGWPEMVGVPMNLLSEAQWRDAVEAAGLDVLEQTRLYPPAELEVEDWKREVGSLLTLARRPE